MGGLTKDAILRGLRKIGLEPGMEVEVHSSLRSFGYVEGGAETVIAALQEAVGEAGSIFMPALRLSPELPLTQEDRALGITVKIKILPPDCPRSAMGIVADTFRRLPDTRTGEGIYRVSAWGKHRDEALGGGLRYLLDHGGKGLLLGVDIYKLTAMHYVEELLPQEVRELFRPSEEISLRYPPEEWLVEAGAPPVKPWYTIQTMAEERGIITRGSIGECPVMFFDLWGVVGLYETELRRDPLGLYGLR